MTTQQWLICVKASFRIFIIICFIATSVTVNLSWMSFLCVALFAVSLYCFKSDDKKSGSESIITKMWDATSVNPFRGKIGPGYLTPPQQVDIARKVADLVLYDASNVQSIKNFDVIKRKTECVFAKRSKIWGSPSYNKNITLEENIRRIIPTFYKFTLAFESLSLDAFVIELPGALYGANIQVFGDAVRRVLITLREGDLKRKCDKVLKTDKLDEELLLKLQREKSELWYNGIWVFEFNIETFFITTFAPFYPESNSRFSFGCKNCYILFQPEMSFAIHDIPPDTAETKWVHPRTVRDRIRIAFKDAGREYESPLKQGEPLVCDIVKRVNPDDELYKWWLPQDVR